MTSAFALMMTVFLITGESQNVITGIYASKESGNDSNLLIVFYVQIMPDDFVMQLHRF